MWREKVSLITHVRSKIPNCPLTRVLRFKVILEVRG